MKKISDKRLKKLGGKVYSTIQNRSQIKKRSRPKAETLRIYGPPPRRVFVKSLPCAACGVEGFTVQAHVAPSSEKGTGYKAGYEWIAPLCDERWTEYGDIEIGCHTLFDEHRSTFDARFPQFNPEDAARETQKLWVQYLEENQK